MADRYLLEGSAVDGYLLEDATGILLLEISVPTIETVGAPGVGNTSATLMGNIVALNDGNCDIRGFDYGIDTGYGSETIENGSFGTGYYELIATPLSPVTLYHFRAKVHNSVGWGYGSDMEFTTTAANSTLILRPNGAGSETSITSQYPDSTYHWDKVDEESPDDNGTYVYQTTTSYLRDLYAIPNHTSESGTINSITVYFRVATGNEGYGYYAKPSIKSDSTVTDGTSYSSSSATYATYSQTWTTNPADSQPWEWADIDALQIGVQIRQTTAGKSARCTQVYVEVDYTSAGGVPTTVTPDTLVLNDIEYAPVLKFGIIPSTLALNDTEYNAVTGYGYVPTTLSHTGTKYAPVLKYGIIPSTLVLDDVEYIPILKFGIIPSTLSLTTTKYIPVLKEVTTPITLALNDTEYIPILKYGIIPTTLALNDTEYIPVLKFGIIPTTLALNDTEYNAMVGYGYVPTTLALTTTEYIPVLKLKVTAGLLSLTIASFAPSPSTGYRYTPSTLELNTAKYIPVLKFSIIPNIIALVVSSYAPDIFVPTILTPETLALITSKFAPVLELEITPETKSLLTSLFSPSIIQGTPIIVPVLDLSDTEYAPSVYIYKRGAKSITAIYADRTQGQVYPDRSQSIFDTDKSQNQAYPDRSQAQSFPDRSQNQEMYTE